MSGFHNKFVGWLKQAQTYTKFWVAVAGGVLIIVTDTVAIDPTIQGWVLKGLAIATAFSVYAFPNSVADAGQIDGGEEV